MLDGGTVLAARALASPLAREILQELSQAGFARERDLGDLKLRLARPVDGLL
jgi:hypothetical protein